MKNMKSLKIIAMLAIATGITLASCQKDSLDPTASSLGVKIQATNKSFQVLKSTWASTPAFTWDSSFMIVSKITFEAEKLENEMSHDSSEFEIEWTGPKKVDLFDLNSLIGNIILQPGEYHEISLKVKALKRDAGTSPVFYLSGTYTNSEGSVIPIAVVVDEDLEFRVKQEGAVIDSVTEYTSLINLNLSLLLSDIVVTDLDGATLTDGKIIISNSSNVSLYDKVISQFSTCTESEFSRGRELESGDDRNGSGSDDGSGSGSDDGNGSNSGNGNGSGSDDGNGSNSGNGNGSNSGSGSDSGSGY
jgi:hypothetical protein